MGKMGVEWQEAREKEEQWKRSAVEEGQKGSGQRCMGLRGRADASGRLKKRILRVVPAPYNVQSSRTGLACAMRCDAMLWHASAYLSGCKSTLPHRVRSYTVT